MAPEPAVRLPVYGFAKGFVGEVVGVPRSLSDTSFLVVVRPSIGRVVARPPRAHARMAAPHCELLR